MAVNYSWLKNSDKEEFSKTGRGIYILTDIFGTGLEDRIMILTASSCLMISNFGLYVKSTI